MNDGRRTCDVEVSIIVVTYGAREMALACLEAIGTKSDGVRTEVIVIDNASSGALAAEIASRHPHIRVFPQVANLGFAAAANLGAEAARGKYLLFLNPDTLIGGDTMSRLLEFVRSQSRVGPLGVRTRFADGRANPTSCRRRPTLWRLLCSGLGLDTRFPHSGMLSGMRYPALPDTGAFAVDIVCGVCLLVERTEWDRLAGFSPKFFMYGEDDDFSLRARRIGWSPMLAPDIAIVHHGSGTEPNQTRKMCQLLAARSLIIGGYFGLLARPLGRALLLLRPCLGRYFGKREFRPLWHNVWTKRRQWLSGRFA